jgi:hypothetical protein
MSARAQFARSSPTQAERTEAFLFHRTVHAGEYFLH